MIMTIKKKDLTRIVKDYQEYFPDWKTLRNMVIFRESGPVLQGILFDKATINVYKPTAFIRNLSAPYPADGIIMELVQRLRHRNGAPDRSIGLQSHPTVIREVVQELKRQVVPPLDQPLNPIKVLTLYEKMAQPTTKQAYSLASLHAFLGFNKDAQRWINEYKRLLSERKMYGYVTENEKVDEHFINMLNTWIQEGIARTRLEIIVEEEKKKLGIT